MKFTDEDLKQAISEGIFDQYNNVIANPSQVIRFFEKWAERIPPEECPYCDGDDVKTQKSFYCGDCGTEFN